MEKLDRSIKFACDREGKGLGKIVRIKSSKINQFPKKTQIEFVILKKFLFTKAIKISLPEKLIIRIQDNRIIFDISKEEFNLFLKKALAQRKHMVQSAEFAEATANEKAMAISFSWGKL